MKVQNQQQQKLKYSNSKLVNSKKSQQQQLVAIAVEQHQEETTAVQLAVNVSTTVHMDKKRLRFNDMFIFMERQQDPRELSRYLSLSILFPILLPIHRSLFAKNPVTLKNTQDRV
jgi:hypothetical protein